MQTKQPINSQEIRAVICAALNVSPQAVSNWNSRGVPIEHCAAIEKATNGAVTRKDLRPNDWQLIWPELEKKATRASNSRQPAANFN